MDVRRPPRDGPPEVGHPHRLTRLSHLGATIRAMTAFVCPACDRTTDVEVPKSSHMLGSTPPLTVRFTCAGCGIVLNATTNQALVWPDRPPKHD